MPGIIYRSGLGRELTFDEMDANFKYAEGGLNNVAMTHPDITTTIFRDVEVDAAASLTYPLLVTHSLNDANKTYRYLVTIASATGVQSFEGNIYYTTGINDFSLETTNNSNSLAINDRLSATIVYLSTGADTRELRVVVDPGTKCRLNAMIYQGMGKPVGGGGSGG